jgi:hypothetical protein
MLFWLIAVLTAALVLAPGRAAEPARGGEVQWARLIGGGEWDRHTGGDDALLAFLRDQTSLNIDRKWEGASPARLEELCKYPFIFSTGLYGLSKTQRGNLAEYLRRGGFLLLDACGNSHVNPSLPRFRDLHLAILREEFPELRVTSLTPEHPVFSIHFKIRERPPQARQTLAEPAYPLYALYDGERLIGILSINSLQCGWSGHSRVAKTPEFREMVANIYVYAMTR